MSDDFDDDLYNVYNGGGQEDSYNDEDLYGDDPVTDIKEEEVKAEPEEKDDTFAAVDSQSDQQDESIPSDQHTQQVLQQQQQRQQMRYQQQQQNNNWGNFQGNPYQQYMAAYQRNLQQQMAMNPYQMQQMIQNQMRQQQQQQQQRMPNQHNKAQYHSIKKEAADEGIKTEDDENKASAAANQDVG
jgi:hypothetical protein